MHQPETNRPLWITRLLSIGPAMIIAAVVLGPGSITTASKVGCRYGYSLGWVLVLATTMMIGMTLASLVIGLSSEQTAATRIRNRFGKIPTVLLGIVVFLIVALFQSSNNRALLLAAEVVYPDLANRVWLAASLLVVSNGLVIYFFLFSRSVYKLIERFMLALVATMLVCFGFNAIWGGLDLTAGLKGLFPSVESLSAMKNSLTGDLRAMIGTTFSVAGAFYQAYLVRERGWGKNEYYLRWFDPVVGISTLGLLTLLIMYTAAASLHGQTDPDQITDLRSLASTLSPTFGPIATMVFAGGILAGAVSSFAGNALVGGTILSDSLGMGAKATERGPRGFTILALLVGMSIALLSLLSGMSSVAFIVVAQSLTTLGLPVMASVILYLLIAEQGHRKYLIVWVSCGFLVAVYVALATLASLIK